MGGEGLCAGMMQCNLWSDNISEQSVTQPMSEDWKIQLRRDRREVLVRKIMETLQRFTSSPDDPELYRVARSFEQKIFLSATTQDDYFKKISEKMLLIRSKGKMAQLQQQGWAAAGPGSTDTSAASSCILQASEGSVHSPSMAPGPSGMHTVDQWGHIQQGMPGQQRQQYPQGQQACLGAPDASELSASDRIWQKLQELKQEHLKDVMELFQFLKNKSQQNLAPEELKKLECYHDLVSRMIPYLSIPRDRVPPSFTLEKVGLLEEQITQVLNIFRRKGQQGAPSLAQPMQDDYNSSSMGSVC